MNEAKDTLNIDFINNLPYAQISSGFLAGLSVGYFFKKSFKIMLFVMGLVLVATFWLKSNSVIEVDNNSILSSFDTIINGLKMIVTYLHSKLSDLEISGGAGAVAGFLVGLKIG